MGRGRQETFPDWWHRLDAPARLREQLAAHFTITKDGYARWYRGRSAHVCAKTVPPGEVFDRWRAKQDAIDRADAGLAADPAPLSYRDALVEFLGVQKARVDASRKPIALRTYHNYVEALNAFGEFAVDGRKIADTPLADIGPRHFSAYARTLAGWKASGFDSVVCRVGALFRWAAGMEYIVRYRPGPEFVRPPKAELRDQRIGLVKSFPAADVARLYLAAGPAMRCMVALGCCAAFNNADVANVPREVVDLRAGVIDYRRRKTGRVRRVIPLPPGVAELLAAYRRPDPAEPGWDGLFFVTRHGRPYGRTNERKGRYVPGSSVSRLFRELMAAAKVEHKPGRNFAGLRTTFYNLAPRGEWELERRIVMGRAQGTVDLDSYLEDVGLDRLRHVVNHVWSQVTFEIARLSSGRPGASPASPPREAGPPDGAGPAGGRTGGPGSPA